MPTVVEKRRPSLFICEPDHATTHPLAEFMSARGFTVDCIPESGQAIDRIITRVPDVVVLAADLPTAGGYEVCSAVRAYYNGLILILGRDRDETAQLLAFELGADDYIFVPASPALLAARIGAHLKRRYGSAVKDANHRIRVGELVVDARRREVFLAGQPIDLTTIQFELLWYLAKRSGRVVSREEIYEALYQQKYNGFDRSVDVYISRIRQQLRDSAENPNYLKTVRGVGYLFVGCQ